MGPAIVYIGATGSTPTTDLGAVASVDFELTAESEDIMLGAPRQLIDVLPSQEEASLSVTLYEWDLNNFARAIGAGTTTATTYTYGAGDVSRTKYAVRAQHRVIGSGNTFDIRIWQAVPDGNYPVTLDDGVTEFEMMFRVIQSTTDWAGAAANSYLDIVEIT